ncbi:MAG: hypothetical protein DLM70_17465 [Chloroflexi bacterium]|nr:MAG: hypothetical protein DLM70_17465 [Chloroflexota bacterium]
MVMPRVRVCFLVSVAARPFATHSASTGDVRRSRSPNGAPALMFDPRPRDVLDSGSDPVCRVVDA